MNKQWVNSFLSKFVKPRWQIGFLLTPLENLVSGSDQSFVWIKNPYHDGWFADPFVLDVTDQFIELLVEDFRFKDRKGRISKIVIDKQTLKVIRRNVLLEGGHYSFPAILRNKEKVYVYPEQSRQSRLDLFEYDATTNTLNKIQTLSNQA